MNITVPVVIDVNLATLLQAQLGLSLGIGANATIFQICAAIDAAGGINEAAVIAALTVTLGPIVTAQVQALDSQIAAILISTGVPSNVITPTLINTIINGISVPAIIAQITANVQVSLGILEACLGQVPPPPTTETLTVIKNTECQADNQTCEQNPIQPSNFTVVIDGNNPSQNNFPGSSTNNKCSARTRAI